MTSTWVDADDPGKCHTWCVWGSRIRKKQIDYTMVLGDLQSTTWYLNKTKLRIWYHHFPVVVETDGKELRVKKGTEWIPKSEDERHKFQKLALCPTGSRGWVEDGQEGGLEVLQERLEGAVASVEATTTATKNKNECKIPDEIRMIATETSTY